MNNNIFDNSQNYIIYIFRNNKCIDSFYTDTLESILLFYSYRDCEIECFDMHELKYLQRSQIDMKIMNANFEKLKVGIQPDPAKMKFYTEVFRKKQKKYWEQPIKCVETGEIFSSVRECSKHFKIPYKSLWNAINSGNERDGLHFINIKESK